MGAMQRRKGAVGEREVAGILRDWLGVDIQRNWQGQSAQGGSDLSDLPEEVLDWYRLPAGLSAVPLLILVFVNWWTLRP